MNTPCSTMQNALRDFEWQQNFQRHGATHRLAYLRQLSFLLN